MNSFRFAARRNADSDMLRFSVIVQQQGRQRHEVVLKAVCGPGDAKGTRHNDHATG